MRLRRDCLPIRGNGQGGWQWVRGQRLASWERQSGLERSTEQVSVLSPPLTQRQHASEPSTQLRRICS
jgi:hypothetical protein